LHRPKRADVAEQKEQTGRGGGVAQGGTHLPIPMPPPVLLTQTHAGRISVVGRVEAKPADWRVSTGQGTQNPSNDRVILPSGTQIELNPRNPAENWLVFQQLVRFNTSSMPCRKLGARKNAGKNAVPGIQAHFSATESL